MKSWLIILCGLGGSWYFIDLKAESALENLFAPLVFGLMLMLVLIKGIIDTWRPGGHGSGNGGWSDSGGFGGGGDGGGGCGGDGGGGDGGGC